MISFLCLCGLSHDCVLVWLPFGFGNTRYMTSSRDINIQAYVHSSCFVDLTRRPIMIFLPP